MKKATLLASLLILGGLVAGLSIAGPTAQDVPVTTELSTPLADLLGTEAGMFPPFPGPTYCGDPCSPNGSSAGCIDTSGPVWRRVICYCVNGYLTC